MKTSDLRQLIKESIQEYIREVDKSGDISAQEAKIRACEEAIALREKKINMEGLDEAFMDMIDETKKKNLEKEIKELQKYKLKTERLLEKMKSKTEKKSEKEVVEDGVEEEGMVGEVTIDEMDMDTDSQLEEAKKKKLAKDKKEEKKEDKKEDKKEKEQMNESFFRMQKLAGIIK